MSLIGRCGVQQSLDISLGIDVGLEGGRPFRYHRRQRRSCDKPAASGISDEPKKSVVSDVPTGCQRSLARQKRAYLVSRDVSQVGALPYGPAKSGKHLTVGSESLAKRFPKRGVLVDD